MKDYLIGLWETEGAKLNPMVSEQHGTYVGPIEKLKGKTALLLPGSNPSVLRVQFDDRDTGYGYGWHTFSKSSFEIDSEVDFENVATVVGLCASWRSQP